MTEVNKIKTISYNGVNSKDSIHAKTIRDIGSGALEGLLAIPSYLRKIDDVATPLTYQLSGIPGLATAFTTFIATLEGSVIEKYGYGALIPLGVLALTNALSAYHEAVRYTKKKEEDDLSKSN